MLDHSHGVWRSELPSYSLVPSLETVIMRANVSTQESEDSISKEIEDFGDRVTSSTQVLEALNLAHVWVCESRVPRGKPDVQQRTGSPAFRKSWERSSKMCFLFPLSPAPKVTVGWQALPHTLWLEPWPRLYLCPHCPHLLLRAPLYTCLVLPGCPVLAPLLPGKESMGASATVTVVHAHWPSRSASFSWRGGSVWHTGWPRK